MQAWSPQLFIEMILRNPLYASIQTSDAIRYLQTLQMQFQGNGFVYLDLQAQNPEPQFQRPSPIEQKRSQKKKCQNQYCDKTTEECTIVKKDQKQYIFCILCYQNYKDNYFCEYCIQVLKQKLINFFFIRYMIQQRVKKQMKKNGLCVKCVQDGIILIVKNNMELIILRELKNKQTTIVENVDLNHLRKEQQFLKCNKKNKFLNLNLQQCLKIIKEYYVQNLFLNQQQKKLAVSLKLTDDEIQQDLELLRIGQESTPTGYRKTIRRKRQKI